MPSFDEVSVLSDELGQWIGAARERYASLVEYADRVNAMSAMLWPPVRSATIRFNNA
ncbi:hypothetical protein [Burkholderia ubonensis]|uniref:hypothetical protein n=1 Tax=Burkholderia ubonensis TaxID=101571 RepID=UPI0015C7C9D8|nr:hypothetical protein [Burkholderia ubonensis]